MRVMCAVSSEVNLSRRCAGAFSILLMEHCDCTFANTGRVECLAEVHVCNVVPANGLEVSMGWAVAHLRLWNCDVQ